MSGLLSVPAFPQGGKYSMYVCALPRSYKKKVASFTIRLPSAAELLGIKAKQITSHFLIFLSFFSPLSFIPYSFSLFPQRLPTTFVCVRTIRSNTTKREADMKFGIQLAGGAPIRTRTAAKEIAAAAEELGFDSIVDRRSHRHSQKNHCSVAI